MYAVWGVHEMTIFEQLRKGKHHSGQRCFFSHTELSFVLFVNSFTTLLSWHLGQGLSVVKVKSTQPFQTVSFWQFGLGVFFLST